MPRSAIVPVAARFAGVAALLMLGACAGRPPAPLLTGPAHIVYVQPIPSQPAPIVVLPVIVSPPPERLVLQPVPIRLRAPIVVLPRPQPTPYPGQWQPVIY